jgi:hypothetical protein
MIYRMFVRVIPDLGSHVLPRTRTHQHGGSSARRVCRTGALLIFRQRPRIMSWCLGPTAKQSRTDANGCTPSGPRATKGDFQRCGEFPDGTVAKMIKDYILCGSEEKITFDWLKGKSIGYLNIICWVKSYGFQPVQWKEEKHIQNIGM